MNLHSDPFVEKELKHRLHLAKQLVFRLERLSADSIWARRASGYRASLLKIVERYENSSLLGETAKNPSEDCERLGKLVEGGYHILDQAAREILKGRRSIK